MQEVVSDKAICSDKIHWFKRWQQFSVVTDVCDANLNQEISDAMSNMIYIFPRYSIQILILVFYFVYGTFITLKPVDMWYKIYP